MKKNDIEDLINEINAMYKVWLVCFPFELSSLKHLKHKYFNQTPPYNDSRVFDWDEDFEGVAPLHTKESFCDYLTELTINLIEVNTYRNLYLNGNLPDKNKCLIELSECQRRIKDDMRRNDYLELKLPYVEYINGWLEDETAFLLNDLPLYEKENEKKGSNQKKKISAKWYALLHIFKINAGLVKAFPLTENDKFDFKLIKKFAEDNYPVKDGQGFYRAFKDFYGETREVFNKSFGKNYKQRLVEMTNDPLLIAYIEKTQ